MKNYENAQMEIIDLKTMGIATGYITDDDIIGNSGSGHESGGNDGDDI